MCASDSAAAVFVIIRSARRSKLPRFESAISIENIVGTPGNTVTCSRAITSSTLTGNEKLRSMTTRGTQPERHQHLVQPVVERQRQGAQDDVVTTQTQVRAHRPSGSDHVEVGEHHALGAAGGARGVDDRREVDIDEPEHPPGGPTTDPATDALAPSGLSRPPATNTERRLAIDAAAGPHTRSRESWVSMALARASPSM